MVCDGETRFAFILIGYQKDYFSKDGKLHSVIQASSEMVLENTMKILRDLEFTSVLFIETPIIFTKDYRELREPTGILKAIKDLQAFKAGDPGSETIPEIAAFGDRILKIPGKRGLNAFAGTGLLDLLRAAGVTDVVLCGAVTSICIDSTGRAAHEMGFRVHQLADCTCGRTKLEQEQYCHHIFPLYANVVCTEAIIALVSVTQSTRQFELDFKRMHIETQCSRRCTSASENLSDLFQLEDTDGQEQDLDSSTFMQLCNVERISEWLSVHPEKMAELKLYQDELHVQIQSRLMDHAAELAEKNTALERMCKESQSHLPRSNSNLSKCDEEAPLVSWVCYTSEKTGGVARLLKLMLKKLILLRRRSDSSAVRKSLLPHILLDLDHGGSTSESCERIQSAGSLLVLLTKEILDDQRTILQLIAAWEHGVPIIPVQVATDESEALPADTDAAVAALHPAHGAHGGDRLEKARQVFDHLWTLPAVSFDSLGSRKVQWRQAHALGRRIIESCSQESLQGCEALLSTQDPVVTFLQPGGEPGLLHSTYVVYNRADAAAHTASGVVKLLLDDMISLALGTTFIEDEASEISELRLHIDRAQNILVLLTPGALFDPHVIMQLVQAYRNGKPIIPVPIAKDFDFSEYCSEDFCFGLLDMFSEQVLGEFKRHGIPFKDICKALRKMFRGNIQPFFPWAPETVQHTQACDLTQQFEFAAHAEARSRSKAKALLYDAFPKHVADLLMAGKHVQPENRECVTVFFSDIVGFTELSAALSPEKVGDLLQRLIEEMDDLAEQMGVFKLETIGDAYLCATNLVCNQVDSHAARMAAFSLAVVQAARHTLIDTDNPAMGHVQIRIGLSCGSCIAAVVGHTSPKYTVYGDTVNTASRMESSSLPGRIQCTARVAELIRLQDPSIVLAPRGEMLIKGKGLMETYWIEGKRDE